MSLDQKIQDKLAELDYQINQTNLNPQALENLLRKRSQISMAKGVASLSMGNGGIAAISDPTVTQYSIFGQASNSNIVGAIDPPGANNFLLITGVTFSYSIEPAQPSLFILAKDNIAQEILLSFYITSKGVGPVPVNIPVPLNTGVLYSLASPQITSANSTLTLTYSIVEKSL